jgi:putative ABC transport system permease protein
MISRIEAVTAVDDTGSLSNTDAYRSPLIPSINTNALSVQATSLGLPHTVGTSVVEGSFLNAATAHEPVAVLGAAAASRMGIDRIYPGERIWVGGQWFYLVGILRPAVLAPEIDTSVLIGYSAAQKYLGFDGHPSEIYLRVQTDKVNTFTTSSPPPPTPNSPTRSTWPSPPTRWLPKPRPKAR